MAAFVPAASAVFLGLPLPRSALESLVAKPPRGFLVAAARRLLAGGPLLPTAASVALKTPAARTSPALAGGGGRARLPGAGAFICMALPSSSEGEPAEDRPWVGADMSLRLIGDETLNKFVAHYVGTSMEALEEYMIKEEERISDTNTKVILTIKEDLAALQQQCSAGYLTVGALCKAAEGVAALGLWLRSPIDVMADLNDFDPVKYTVSPKPLGEGKDKRDYFRNLCFQFYKFVSTYLPPKRDK